MFFNALRQASKFLQQWKSFLLGYKLKFISHVSVLMVVFKSGIKNFDISFVRKLYFVWQVYNPMLNNIVYKNKSFDI